MKNVIQILYVEKRAGRSKNGNDYDMRLAQCVIERLDDSGNPAPLIGELSLPQEYKDTLPGRYEVTFGIAVDANKRVGARVIEMVPMASGRQSPPPAAAAATAAPAKA